MAKQPKDIAFAQKLKPAQARVLTTEAAQFLAQLHRASEPQRQRLLKTRAERSADAKGLPEARGETAAIRSASWKITALPPDLQDRRVSLVTATDRRSILNGLNSSAKTCSPDFTDPAAASWDMRLEAQAHLMDRWTSAMEFTDPESGKRVGLARKPAVLMPRIASLADSEDILLIDGKPISSAILDAGLYLFHNAKTALAKTSGPYFWISDVTGEEEAQWWNRVFLTAESLLGLPLFSIKATLSIDTLPAFAEIDEIIFALRDRMAGLGFDEAALALSALKHGTSDGKAMTFDGKGAAQFFVDRCHRRGCLALSTIESAADEAQVKDVVSEQARMGFDGAALSGGETVAAALAIFNDLMPTANQIYVSRDTADKTIADFMRTETEPPSEADLKRCIETGLRFLSERLVPADANGRNGHLSAERAELARTKLWLALKNGIRLEKRQRFTPDILEGWIKEQLVTLKQELGADGFEKNRCKDASSLLRSACLAAKLDPELAILASRKAG